MIKSRNRTKGLWVAQWVGMIMGFNLKTLCAKGRWFKSSFGHLIDSMKKKTVVDLLLESLNEGGTRL